ncbi:phosphate ABC transporter permease PstA [Longispora albida]|uniref:phosphate ABC transporter permease PstA n=1 Tax=Longispora albida TaxID=203523 RepID=UPI000362C6DB|nr:phosphate ABC transporter permease PstA [Longispora albida]
MVSLTARRLPRFAPLAIGAGAVAVAAGLSFGLGLGGPVMTGILAALLFVAALFGTAWRVEGSRAARNRVASALIYGAFVLAVIPLVSVMFTVVDKGWARLDGTFFGTSMNNISAFDAHGGAYHAIIGTLEQVGIAVLITVPLGILGAVYIVEYGRGKLASWIRFFVDVMTGIPSIVAGLFILAFWVMVVSPMFSADGAPTLSGFAASLALSVLMLPTVVRSTEEMLRLVPNELREGSYALGIPKWKTITKIVLPTAGPGIVTGVMLAIARAAGETAPVMLVAGVNSAIAFNPFESQSSLSYYVFDQATDSSKYAEPRAWAGALTLVAIVLTLTVVAKLLARRSKLSR